MKNRTLFIIWKISIALFAMIVIQIEAVGRLFNAPSHIKTSLQVVGADWAQLLSQYQARESEYNIRPDFYSYFINCQMLQSQAFSLTQSQNSTLKQSKSGIQIHFECNEKDTFNQLKSGDQTLLNLYQKFFTSVLQIFKDAPSDAVLLLRPCQEFNNPWTGYPWVLEQWWNLGGCACNWCSCNSGFYSEWGNLDKNRNELNAVLKHLHNSTESAATSIQSAHRFKFITAIDANQLNADPNSHDRVADDISAVSEGVARYY